VAGAPVPRPWRLLGIFSVLLVALAGTVVVQGATTPRLGLDLEGGTSITLTAQTTDGQPPSQESLDEARAIIEQRVNGSGIAEAEVTTQGDTSIIVQVPGVGQDELVALVGQTAELQFRPVQAVVPGSAPLSQSPVPTDDAAPDATPEATPGATPEATPERDRASDRTSRGAARAATPAVTPEPTQQPQPIEPVQAGQPTAEQLAELQEFDCADIDQTTITPADEPLITCDRTLSNRYLLAPADIVGTDIAAANAGIPQGGVAWQVNLEFTGDGADKFFASTQRLSAQVPPQDQFAIVLDGLVVSAPQVNEPIPGGRAQITGQFTQDEAQGLANVLRYGALPLAFEVSDVTAVSPTLGADQLRAGLVAGLIGLLLVMLYSLLYYRGLGIVVIASLVVVGAVTYALVVLLGFTLTLASMAGFIVAIGVTADSFVVLFERIRDEVREGRSVRMAVETGWQRARRTIVVSDVVSLLAAGALALFSIGNVRGFALALGLSTLVDLLVVFLFTKPLLTLLVRTRFFGQGHRLSGLDPSRLGKAGATQARGLVGLGNRLYHGETSLPIVGNSRRWYAVSAGLIGFSLLGLIVQGLTLGVEFRGGADLTAAVPGVTEQVVPAVRQAVVDTGVESAAEPRVTLVGEDRVRVQTGALTPEQTTQVRDAAADALDIPPDDITVQVVGPSWGAEISRSALTGLAVFLVLVVLYLALTFEPKMSVAAIAALAHDVLITVGIYAWTGFDVTPASVIGFLTILGYSLYDTVVVFDKVRENTRGITGQSRYTYSEAANLAVNQTLARSINTSIIALLPIGSILFVSLVVLGTGTLKDLALALFVGVAVGTYSSVFLATPLLADLKEREPVMRSLRARVLARRGQRAGTTAPPDESGAMAAAVAATPTVRSGSSTVVVESPDRHQPRRQSRSQRRKES
jgi:protein-export membrane protein SecD/preprotein translocase SecF subunit